MAFPWILGSWKSSTAQQLAEQAGAFRRWARERLRKFLQSLGDWVAARKGRDRLSVSHRGRYRLVAVRKRLEGRHPERVFDVGELQLGGFIKPVYHQPYLVLGIAERAKGRSEPVRVANERQGKLHHGKDIARPVQRLDRDSVEDPAHIQDDEVVAIDRY